MLDQDIQFLKELIEDLQAFKQDLISTRDSSSDQNLKRVYRRVLNKLDKADVVLKDAYFELSTLGE